MQHVPRNARLVQEAHGAGRDQRRLLGGLGHHGIAGGKRARDLTGEDGEREVPRRDGREHAAPVQAHRVALARRPHHHLRHLELGAGFRRVVAQEVDGLAQVGLRVGERLAGLAHHERHELRTVRLEQIGGALQEFGPRHAAAAVPGLARRLRRAERRIDGGGVGRTARADDDAPVMGRGDLDHLPARLDRAARHDGACGRRRS